jgi:hypothetical protein
MIAEQPKDGVSTGRELDSISFDRLLEFLKHIALTFCMALRPLFERAVTGFDTAWRSNVLLV